MTAAPQITAIHTMKKAEDEAVEFAEADSFRSSVPDPDSIGGHVSELSDTGRPKITVVEILPARSDTL